MESKAENPDDAAVSENSQVPARASSRRGTDCREQMSRSRTSGRLFRKIRKPQKRRKHQTPTGASTHPFHGLHPARDKPKLCPSSKSPAPSRRCTPPPTKIQKPPGSPNHRGW
ncbi:hypothetical protein B0H19DRAFT_1152637 [Mycena capillaripes]|nr:hypothetical protein B0H19DRAFT_1152637 [Mycena capillaripes]